MKVLQVKQWIPLLTPQKLFRDKDGNLNAYLDMNPSLYINKGGDITVLVRRVNYRKFQGKQFQLYEQKSITSYMIARGRIEDGRIVLDPWNELTLDTRLPSYPTYWLGMEDIRFCSEDKVLVTIPEKNPGGNPCIFLATLQQTSVTNLQLCYPNQIEKNWMPFTDLSDNPLVIYNVNPFQIKSVVDSFLTTIDHGYSK